MLQQDVLSENLKKQSYQFILQSGRASSKFGLQPSFEIHSFAISRIAVNIPIQHSPLPSLRRIPEGRRELQYWRAGRRLRSLSPLYGNSRKQGKRHLSLYHHLSLYPLQNYYYFFFFFVFKIYFINATPHVIRINLMSYPDSCIAYILNVIFIF
jgi:hypothetical protein